MVTSKSLRFVNRNWDLKELGEKIEKAMQKDDFRTQRISTEKGIVIQAKKEDLLRNILTTTRAITILVAGEPDDFSVEVGIGKWIQNLGVTAVEAVITGGLFLIINIPAMLWNFEVENEIIEKVTRIVESKPMREEIPAA